MVATTAPITPGVLAWALAEDGRDFDDIAAATKVGPETLRAWAEGDEFPTRGELTELADRLQRPRAMFFLPRPPEDAALPSMFRHAAGDEHRRVSHSARRVIRRARRVQQVVAWLLRDSGRSAIDLPQIRQSTSPSRAAEGIRAWLDLGIDEQHAWPNPHAALRGWRRALEERGLLVFQFQIGRDEIRGFSTWDDQAPLVGVNSTGSNPQARIFTICHELGHLATRTDSTCVDWVRPGSASPSTERWCEQFGAALLLPVDEVRTYLEDLQGIRDELQLARAVSRRFKASLRASALRLIDLGLASPSLYATVEGVARPVQRDGPSGGGTPTGELRLREFGPHVPAIVDEAVHSGTLAPRDAVDLLSVTFDQYRQLTGLAAEELRLR